MYTNVTEVVRLLASVIVLILPGVPLALRIPAARRDPVVALTYIAVVGFSCQIVGFWWLRWAPLGLSGLALLLALGGAVGTLVIWRRRPRLEWRGSGTLAWVLVATVFVIVAALRMTPFVVAAVPPGEDMSMHATMTRLIVTADGVPASYRPLLPIDTFGTLGAGLPTLAALATALTGVPVWRSTFFIACLTHVLLALAVFTLARRHGGPVSALLATLVVTLGTRDPQLHFFWGGEPSLLSLALLVAVFPLLDDLADDAWTAVAPIALLLAGAALTHAVLPYAFAYAWLAVATVRTLRSRGAWLRHALAPGVAAAALAAALALPYALGYAIPLSDGELEVVRQWQHLPVHIPSGHGLALLPGLVVYLVQRLGFLLPVWIAAALVARRWGGLRRVLLAEAAFATVTALLVLNALVWVLPASYVLYPDRVATLLVIPAAVVIAEGAEAAAAVSDERRRRLAPQLVAAGLAALLGVSLPLAAWYWYLQGVRYVAVSRNDLDVIRWIAANTPPDALIGTNYGDAGVWIPALAGRPVTSPHVHFLYADEFRAGMAGSRPRYVFVGAKKVAEGGGYTLERLEADTWDYRELYRRDGAAVFLARIAP